MPEKFLGIISLIMGLFGIGVLFFVDTQRILITTSESIISRYSIIFIYIYIFCFFIIMGMLVFMGKVTPYILTTDKRNKAKTELIVSIFSVPLFSFVTVLCFTALDFGLIKYGLLGITMFEVIRLTGNIKKMKT